MTTFLLIRHGQTDSIGRVLCGTAPGVHLNAKGREQVEQLAARLRDVRLTAVASSPLERALETAAPIAAAAGLPVEQTPALAEFDVGEWTGAAINHLDSNDAWRQFNRLRSLTPAPGGESMLDVQRRALAALADLRVRHAGGVVATISHGDVVRALLLYFLGIPIDFLHRLDIGPARISIVELGDGEPVVRQVNGDTAADIV